MLCYHTVFISCNFCLTVRYFHIVLLSLNVVFMEYYCYAMLHTRNVASYHVIHIAYFYRKVYFILMLHWENVFDALLFSRALLCSNLA